MTTAVTTIKTIAQLIECLVCISFNEYSRFIDDTYDDDDVDNDEDERILMMMMMMIVIQSVASLSPTT